MAARTINFAGNEKIYNSDKIDELLNDKQDTLTIDDALNNTSTNPVQNKIINKAINDEVIARENADTNLSAKIGNLNNLSTITRTDVVSAINEVNAKINVIPDTVVSETSTNTVQNKAIYSFVKNEVKVESDERKASSTQLQNNITAAERAAETAIRTEETQRIDADIILQNNIDAEETQRIDADTILQNNIDTLRNSFAISLSTEESARIQGDEDERLVREAADDTLATRINDERTARSNADDVLQDNIDDLENRSVLKANLDAIPDSQHTDTAVTSKGTFDAIRFASVKVGETMLWPQFKEEIRTVVSDKPFEFDLFGTHYEKDVDDKELTLLIADNVPDGWHALDGTTALNEVDYPELAEWFGGNNITVDGKIWLPYCPKTIIKIAY